MFAAESQKSLGTKQLSVGDKSIVKNSSSSSVIATAYKKCINARRKRFMCFVFIFDCMNPIINSDNKKQTHPSTNQTVVYGPHLSLFWLTLGIKRKAV